MSLPDGTPKHVGYIDAVRGLAIMGVVLVHTAAYFPALPWHLNNAIGAGARGVQLFFIASALTLAASWEARNDGAIRFYIRRFFRIAPLFWLALAFYATLSGAWGDWGRIAVSALFINGLHPGWLWWSPVPGAWSVATEMAFYAIFPLAAVLVTSLRRAMAFFVTGIAIDQLLSPQVALSWAPLLGVTSTQVIRDTAWLWLPAEMPVFAMGFVVHFALKAYRPSPLVANAIGLVGLVLVVLLAQAGVRMAEWSLVLGLIVFAMGAGGLLALTNAVTRTLGLASFGIYLVHFVVLPYFVAPTISPGVDQWLMLPTYAAAIGISWIVAFGLHWAVEIPGQNAGRWLIGQMNVRRARRQPDKPQNPARQGQRRGITG